MIDKDLLRLLGGNKKYIGFCVGWMVLGLFANVGITVDVSSIGQKKFYFFLPKTI